MEPFARIIFRLVLFDRKFNARTKNKAGRRKAPSSEEIDSKETRSSFGFVRMHMRTDRKLTSKTLRTLKFRGFHYFCSYLTFRIAPRAFAPRPRGEAIEILERLQNVNGDCGFFLGESFPGSPPFSARRRSAISFSTELELIIGRNPSHFRNRSPFSFEINFILHLCKQYVYCFRPCS